MTLLEKWQAHYRHNEYLRVNGKPLVTASSYAEELEKEWPMRDVRLARERALEIHLWGGKLPALSFGLAQGSLGAGKKPYHRRLKPGAASDR